MIVNKMNWLIMKLLSITNEMLGWVWWIWRVMSLENGRRESQVHIRSSFHIKNNTITALIFLYLSISTFYYIHVEDLYGLDKCMSVNSGSSALRTVWNASKWPLFMYRMNQISIIIVLRMYQGHYWEVGENY